MSETSTTRKRGLGRGLSALMDDYPQVEQGGAGREATRAPIELLEPNPYQPRHRFDAAELDDLAASIRAKGLLQPILVRPAPERKGREAGYQIVAGERRWRAAQKAGLHEVPILVRALDDTEALEVAIVENVQRRDLSPIEEAQGYRRLIDDFGHSQSAVAKVVGKSRSHVANLLRLLGLPESVRAMLDDGRLTMGHARALIGAEDPESLAKRIISQGLTVRQAEALVGETKAATKGRRRKPGRGKDADTRALEADLGRALGLSVSIDHRGERGGRVSIRYRSLEQLDDLCQRLIHH